MIEDDLAYSEGAEEDDRMEDPQSYGKYKEERKRIRQREKLLDELDVQLEAHEARDAAEQEKQKELRRAEKVKRRQARAE